MISIYENHQTTTNDEVSTLPGRDLPSRSDGGDDLRAKKDNLPVERDEKPWSAEELEIAELLRDRYHGREERVGRYSQIMTGYTFNDLLVQEVVIRQSRPTAVVRCVCGSQREFRAANVLYGKIRSCGCSQSKLICAEAPAIPLRTDAEREAFASLSNKSLRGQKRADAYKTILVGRRIGNVVVEDVLVDKYKTVLRCDCGNTTTSKIASVLLSASHSPDLSCGCKQYSTTSARFTKHGHSHSDTYTVWENMISRCDNPTSPSYDKYGAKGITHAPEWSDFRNFLRDMGERPDKKHTLDRIDGTKGYYKENCRWATWDVQSRNRNNNRWLTVNGETMIFADVATKYNIHETTLAARLRRMAPDEAVNTPIKPHKRMVTHNGKTQSLTEWANEAGLPAHTVYNRLDNLGYTFEQSLAKGDFRGRSPVTASPTASESSETQLVEQQAEPCHQETTEQPLEASTQAVLPSAA